MREARVTFAVLVRGMLRRNLEDTTEVVFGKQLRLTSPVKVDF